MSVTLKIESVLTFTKTRNTLRVFLGSIRKAEFSRACCAPSPKSSQAFCRRRERFMRRFARYKVNQLCAEGLTLSSLIQRGTKMKLKQNSPRHLVILGLVIGGVLLGCAQSVSAQWSPIANPTPTPGTNIWYNSGNVGIGTTAPGFLRKAEGIDELPSTIERLLKQRKDGVE